MNKMNFIDKKSFGQVVIVAGLAFLLVACGNDELTVTAQFANTQDIKEGTVVYFENEPTGEVVNTKIEGNGTSVVIVLEQNAAQLISSNAAIVVNRLKQGAPLEIYNPNTTTTDFISDRQQLRGLDSMFQLGAWMVGDAIQLGSSSLTDYVGAFQEYLQGEQFQQDKSNVQSQLSTVANQAQEALSSIESDIVTAIDELAVAEGEVAQSIDQLSEDLSPMVQEIARSGSVLMQQLEEFTAGLEKSDTTEQQAGQTFLDSLIAMLEKLNHSIEEGVDESKLEETGSVND